jgi:hypothetical protein
MRMSFLAASIGYIANGYIAIAAIKLRMVDCIVGPTLSAWTLQPNFKTYLL